MGIEGTSPVQQDGRIRMPQTLRDKYSDDYFAWVEREPGKLELHRVEVE